MIIQINTLQGDPAPGRHLTIAKKSRVRKISSKFFAHMATRVRSTPHGDQGVVFNSMPRLVLLFLHCLALVAVMATAPSQAATGPSALKPKLHERSDEATKSDVADSVTADATGESEEAKAVVPLDNGDRFEHHSSRFNHNLMLASLGAASLGSDTRLKHVSSRFNWERVLAALLDEDAGPGPFFPTH